MINIFDDYTRRLISTLQEYEVSFLVVGGYAVNYYGYVRTTGDIDLWVQPENGHNKQNFLKALSALGIEKGILAALEKLDFTAAHVFSDGEPPHKIDFLTKVSGVTFSEAWGKKVIIDIDGLHLPFISLNHLILSKIGSERLKDKADLEALQKIRASKKRK